MPVIDFHSHILPGIDDGSRDVPTSLEMLHLAAAQGVDWMVATPHFYAWRDRMDDFLRRREEAFAALSSSLSPELPRILIGAEAAFFPGISTFFGCWLFSLVITGKKLQVKDKAASIAGLPTQW
jgi:protein-tyrosine phosphatase